MRAPAASDEASTTIALAVDGQPAALLYLRDEPRVDAAETVKALHQLGIRTAIVSADQAAVAEAVAGQLGIPEVRARGSAR